MFENTTAYHNSTLLYGTQDKGRQHHISTYVRGGPAASTLAPFVLAKGAGHKGLTSIYLCVSDECLWHNLNLLVLTKKMRE